MLIYRDNEIIKAYFRNKLIDMIDSRVGEEPIWVEDGPTPVNPYATPFTITAIEDTQIGMTHKGTNATTTIPQLEYSRDGKSWTAWDYTTLSLNTDESLYFRGDNSRGISHGTGSYSYFTSSAKINLSGNIMSLMHKDDFETNWGLTEYCFCYILNENRSIVDASELLLPATTLASNCYRSMFYNCTSLVTVPKTLPATTLAYQCYTGMFDGCASLVNAPVLPATTLATYCYSTMFYGCTSLVTAPELPATTLATNCYAQMFRNCKKLTDAPKTLPATTLATSCYSSMFYGCTSLVTAPELPATTLVQGCYNYMFFGCNKLNYIKAMFTTTPDTSCNNAWVQNVSPTGTFVKNSAATWDVTGYEGVPSGWTIEYV